MYIHLWICCFHLRYFLVIFGVFHIKDYHLLTQPKQKSNPQSLSRLACLAESV